MEYIRKSKNDIRHSIFDIRYSKNCGFTLIEVLIYSGLLALLMSGTLGAVYLIIQGNDRAKSHVLIDDEANFVLKKLDWALGGVTDPVNIISPLPGFSSATLVMSKPSLPAAENPLRFSLIGNDIVLRRGLGVSIPLDSQNVIVSSLSFQHLPASGSQPGAIKAGFYLNGQKHETTKHFRQ